MEKLLRRLLRYKCKGHKTWTVRAAKGLTCFILVRNMSTDQVADKIWMLKLHKKKIKAKMKMISWIVLFFEKQDKHTYQVIMAVLIVGIETTREKMFGSSGKRHMLERRVT